MNELVQCAPYVPKGATLLLLDSGVVAVRYLGIADGGRPRLIGYETGLRWR